MKDVHSEPRTAANVIDHLLLILHPPEDGGADGVHVLQRHAARLQDGPVGPPGQPDRGMHMRLGDFFWQDAGSTRAVRNSGTTTLNLVEFELK